MRQTVSGYKSDINVKIKEDIITESFIKTLEIHYQIDLYF